MRKIFSLVMVISLVLPFFKPEFVNAETDSVKIHVSLTGDDSLNGKTEENALKTIKKACEKISAFQRYIREGT